MFGLNSSRLICLFGKTLASDTSFSESEHLHTSIHIQGHVILGYRPNIYNMIYDVIVKCNVTGLMSR